MKKIVVICSPTFAKNAYRNVAHVLRNVFEKQNIILILTDKSAESISHAAAEHAPSTILFADAPYGMCNNYREKINLLVETEPEYFALERNKKSTEELCPEIICMETVDELPALIAEQKVA